MSRLRSAVTLVVLAVVAVLLMAPAATAAPATTFAGQSLQDCFDQAENHDGEPPTCTDVDGGWEASWDDGMPSSSGIVAVIVVVVLIGIAGTVWKVSTARTLATRSGLDPGLATQVALLTDNGLEATYLASSLRERAPAAATPVVPAPASASAAERLGELRSLLDSGLITQTEHDARRSAIIDSV